MVTDLSLLSQLVSVPFQGEWRFLRFNPEFKEWNYWFPSPLEVNGVSNAEPYQVRTLDLRFPYPRELNRGSYKRWYELELQIELFPPPPEVTGGSYVLINEE